MAYLHDPNYFALDVENDPVIARSNSEATAPLASQAFVSADFGQCRSRSAVANTRVGVEVGSSMASVMASGEIRTSFIKV